MPLGTPHTVEGILFRNGRGDLCLRCDDGGEWRLDAPAMARKLVGSRVTIVGTRDAFDLLAVSSIQRHGGRREPFMASWQFAAGVATSLLAVAIAAILLG